MNRTFWRTLTLALALLLGLAVPALAGDKVTLKDGRVFEGTITREDGGYVWIKLDSGGMEMFFKPDEIAAVEKDAGNTDPATPAAAPAQDKQASRARTGEATRIAIITLGEVDKEMVGVYITADSLKSIIPTLEEQQVDVVIFKIYSGGGFAIEPEKIAEVIHHEYKPRFTTVAWIESAISAAAMSMHCLERIYFMPQGNYGACTAWSGALVGVKGRDLEGYLYLMEKISQMGGHDEEIMRSMQVDDPLSASFDANGDVTWNQDETGQYLVNPKGQILTFNATTAEKFKFSQGTARTHEELARLMGYEEVEWVGEHRDGVPWPVCKADDDLRKFRNRTRTDENNLNNYFQLYQQSIQIAQGQQEREDRGKFVGRARMYLEKIKAMVRNNPNMSILIGFGPDDFKEWIEEQERILRELMK